MSQFPPPPNLPPQPPMPPGGPTPLNYGRPQRNDLKEIAKRQRAIQICILFYILAIFGQFLLPQELRWIVGLVALVVIITATVFVFMLALALYSTGVGVLLGILTLVPCIGLIALLIVNGKATNVLRDHGIKVGLLGADPSQVPDVGPPPPS